MYRRPKFLEVLLEIRQEMSREADYDMDLFAEMIRGGKFSNPNQRYELTEPKVEKISSNGEPDKNRKSQVANRKS